MLLAKKIRNAMDRPKTAAKKEKGCEERPPSIIDLIEEVNQQSTELLHFFRPSMLFGCDRANVFHYQCAPFHPQRVSPRLKRILDNGTAIHEVIQKYLSDHREWWFAPEARIYRRVAGAWIRGSCDGVLIRRSDMYRCGIEIKTINHEEFVRLAKAKPGHVDQATTYAKLMGLTWIVVVYWDKGTQNLKEFPVRVSERRWNETKERVRHLKMYVDKRELPKFNPSTCDVTFCTFVDHCRRKGAPV